MSLSQNTEKKYERRIYKRCGTTRTNETRNRLVVVYYESIINRLEEFFVVYYYESRKRERRFNIDKVRAVARLTIKLFLGY